MLLFILCTAKGKETKKKVGVLRGDIGAIL